MQKIKHTYNCIQHSGIPKEFAETLFAILLLVLSLTRFIEVQTTNLRKSNLMGSLAEALFHYIQVQGADTVESEANVYVSSILFPLNIVTT